MAFWGMVLIGIAVVVYVLEVLLIRRHLRTVAPDTREADLRRLIPFRLGSGSSHVHHDLDEHHSIPGWISLIGALSLLVFTAGILLLLIALIRWGT